MVVAAGAGNAAVKQRGDPTIFLSEPVALTCGKLKEVSRWLKREHALCVSITLVVATGGCARAEDEAVRELVEQWCASRSLCDCGSAEVSASCEFDYELPISIILYPLNSAIWVNLTKDAL